MPQLPDSLRSRGRGVVQVRVPSREDEELESGTWVPSK